MKKFKILLPLLISIFLVVVLVLSGCPAPPVEEVEETTPTPEEETTPEIGEVTLELWEQEGEDIDVIIDTFLADFMGEYPNITINRTHYPNEELRDQFQTASMAGAPPDLVWCPSDFAGPFSTMGLIQPLDEHFDFSIYVESANDAVKLEDKIWGVALTNGNHLMFLYNKSLVESPPEDTDELIAMAKELTTDEIRGFAYNLNEPFYLMPWLGGFGGWPLEETTPTLNTPEMVETLKFVQDLKFEHKVVPEECDYDCADTLFKEGKAAMIINGDWSLGGDTGYIATLGENLGIARIPKISATGNWPSPMTSGKFLMFSVELEGERLEAAKLFANWYTSKEIQLKQFTDMKRLPALIEAIEDPMIAEDALMAASADQMSVGKPMPVVPEMRACWDAIRPQLELIMAGEITPEEAAAAMQFDAETKIEEMKE